MIRIQFDHQAFILQKAGEWARYFPELACALHQLGTTVDIEVSWYRNIYLRHSRLESIVRGQCLTLRQRFLVMHGYGRRACATGTYRLES